jgi:hypothetical protein
MSVYFYFLITFLVLTDLKGANAQNVVGVPFGLEDPGIVVSAGGVGPDGLTTYVVSATAQESNFPIPSKCCR